MFICISGLNITMMKEKGVLEQRLWAVIIKSLYLTIKSKKTNMARFLGIIIDENLNWDSHLEHLEQKLNNFITIKRIKKFIPHEHYSKLYHSLFTSHLTYGVSAWGSMSSDKLQKN